MRSPASLRPYAYGLSKGLSASIPFRNRNPSRTAPLRRVSRVAAATPAKRPNKSPSPQTRLLPLLALSSVDFGLLDQCVRNVQTFPGDLLEPPSCLKWDANLIERKDIGLEIRQFLDNQFPSFLPAFVILFQIECGDFQGHWTFLLDRHSWVGARGTGRWCCKRSASLCTDDHFMGGDFK